ncbi:helix-turn-helix domain-containing protein [Luteipulveratus mongoliensis]|uniref:HTH cro/C1-type domain-containing protein n=1 Tax=Luteipulveratus mongoliensis TaxID=571913 RepID=A0A0K1JJ60_9MICO|nr:helix-turn-helix transcriptional regulator [Luteipulveratus mongoliensis]AKU16633.1 hypothetical protein VV02_13435 [Luteipulveratus mongoliensis]
MSPKPSHLAPVTPIRPVREAEPAPLLRDVFGRLLRRARQDQGRTLADVSGDAGVSLPYLSEVERGLKEPSSEVLEALCGALGASVAELLGAAHRELTSTAPREVTTRRTTSVTSGQGQALLLAA